MKAFMKKNWNYMVAVLLPWIIFILHLIITKLWFDGDGCILSGDAGDIYYTMYSELWDKVHNGGSLFFTWNAGGGSDFFVYLLRYMISPTTILIILLPKAWLVGSLQFCMLTKWSLMMFTMLYYFMHTKHNKIKEHKKLSGLVLAVGFGLSNAMIENLERVGCYDSIILFPVLMLLSEDMEDKKKKFLFYLLLTVCILCNFSVSIPVSIFIIIWYLMHSDKLKGCVWMMISMMLSYVTAIAVIMPGICAAYNHKQLYPWEELSSYMGKGLISFTDFIHRWFIFDSKGIYQTDQPMLYCSVTLLVVSFFYLFVKENMAKKISVILLTLLLTGGMFNCGLNLLWHGYIGADRKTNGFAFLLIFMVLYMAMCVLGRLGEINKLYTVIAGIAGTLCIVAAFFTVYILKEFYVYLVTFLFFILIVMLLFFYCKKSIKHRNMYIVISVFALLELFLNANMRFLDYAVYGVDTMCNRQAKEVLIGKLDLKPGERVAVPQDVADYNMIKGLPAVAGELPYTNNDMQQFARRLGIGWDENMYTYSGASPLINLMFNVRYGISYGEGEMCQAFSDFEKMGENNATRLYSINRLAGLGYMTDKAILDWNVDANSPFEVQNDFVRRAAGTEDIFTRIMPEDIRCISVSPADPRNYTSQVGVATHGVEKAYQGLYDEYGNFVYCFKNGYYGEGIKLEFESDGVTDYYIYVKCDKSIIGICSVDDEILYSDSLCARERTYHIGVVEKGKIIQLISNAEVDNDDLSVCTIEYQIAGFNEDNYSKAYERLSRDTYKLDAWKDCLVNGKINAEEDGIMVTGIPALPGFSVSVDGEKVEYEKVGGALIGIPLDKGEHQVEFNYKTPYIAW